MKEEKVSTIEKKQAKEMSQETAESISQHIVELKGNIEDLKEYVYSLRPSIKQKCFKKIHESILNELFKELGAKEFLKVFFNNDIDKFISIFEEEKVNTKIEEETSPEKFNTNLSEFLNTWIYEKVDKDAAPKRMLDFKEFKKRILELQSKVVLFSQNLLEGFILGDFPIKNKKMLLRLLGYEKKCKLINSFKLNTLNLLFEEITGISNSEENKGTQIGISGTFSNHQGIISEVLTDTKRHEGDIPSAKTLFSEEQSEGIKEFIELICDSDWDNIRKLCDEGFDKSYLNYIKIYREQIYEDILRKVEGLLNQKRSVTITPTSLATMDSRSSSDEKSVSHFRIPIEDVVHGSSGTDDVKSDVDICCVGEINTEQVVIDFNKEFRKNFNVESGTMFDVNVYAESGIHIIALKKRENFKRNNDTSSIDVEIEERYDVHLNEINRKVYEKNQRIASFTKIRIHMNQAGWDEFVESFQLKDMCCVNNREFDELNEILQSAQEQYNQRNKKLINELKRIDEDESNYTSFNNNSTDKDYEDKLLELSKKPEVKKKLMEANNNLYEIELIEIAKIKKHLLLSYNEKENHKLQEYFVEMRERQSISLIYANEAYYTIAAQRGVVWNKQELAKKDNLSYNNVKLEASEYLCYFNEQIGDIFKIIKKLETKEKASFKEEFIIEAGKYMHRMANAFKYLQLAINNKQNQGTTTKNKYIELCKNVNLSLDNSKRELCRVMDIERKKYKSEPGKYKKSNLIDLFNNFFGDIEFYDLEKYFIEICSKTNIGYMQNKRIFQRCCCMIL